MIDQLEKGVVVVIAAFDDVPEHLFEVHEIHEDIITGVALTGPFQGSYGEPSLDQIIRIEPKRLGSR
ncbi:MAG: hypothetical protein JXR14_11885 [Paracoccaceae bacterium]